MPTRPTKCSTIAMVLVSFACVVSAATTCFGTQGGTASAGATIETTWHLGGGSTLGPDGHSIVYVSGDGLHLRDLQTSKDVVLAHEVEGGNAVFENPRFTPDGRHVLVSVSGGTWYYPSDVYLISVDGSRASKLTLSIPTTIAKPQGAVYKQYFYSAVMSPKSSDVLVWVYDAAAAKNYVGMLKSRSVGQPQFLIGAVEIIAEGKPIAWSDDGSSFYFVNGEKVITYDIASGQTRELVTSGKILGIVGPEVIATDNGRNLNFANMRSGKSLTPDMVLPRTFSSLREEFTLKSVQWVPTGLTLLVYRDPRTERIELVNIGFGH